MNGKLNEVIQRVSATEAAHRASEGSSLTWITLIGAGSKVLVEKDASYIEGAVPNSFVITSKKILLGKKFKATVLGIFKVYAEMTVPQGQGDMAKTVGYWHPSDAEQVPLEGNFKRPLPNGNNLEVQHWALLYLPDHPELEGVVLSFKGAGNQYAKKLSKLIKDNSTISPELMVEFSVEQVENKTYKKYFSYPVASVTGKNFEFDNGKVTFKEMKEKEVEVVIDRWADVQEAYDKGGMVARKAALPKAMPEPKQIEATVVDNGNGDVIPF